MKEVQTQIDSRKLHGVAASPGIAIGRALVLVDQQWGRTRRLKSSDEVGLEEARLAAAVAGARQGLLKLKERCDEDLAQFIPIIDSHLLILGDPMLVDRARVLISERMVCVEMALQESLAELEEKLAGLNDQYLRERAADGRHVANLIMKELFGGGEEPDQDEPIILVGHDFSPEDVLSMDSRLVLGFVNEQGGVTGHTAIVARTVATPAVVGCPDLCQEVVSGDLLVVDGNSGLVVVNPDQRELATYQERKKQFELYSEQMSFFAHLPAETKDGRKVAVEANLEMLEEIELALQYGASGIGLFRSEFYYLTQDGPPQEELLVSIYEHLLASMSPFPVTVRTLDIGGDKQVKGHHSRHEKNPALGLKAIRLSLRKPDLFKTQLRALFRASEHGKLRIMFPMITSYCELLEVKEVVAQVRAELRSQGLPSGDDIEIGMMVEVPSAVAVADTLAKEVDFFSIGTNDLIQYAMAVDRVNEQVAHMYNPLHPAVLRMIAQVVEAGHDAGIEVGLCGEMAGDVDALPILLGLGLDTLSMHPLAIPYVKKMVRKTVSDEAEMLAVDLLECPSAVVLQERLKGHLEKFYPHASESEPWLAGERA
ncbi:MAG: phosphoenolpyruvate--protein phosphotransferase [Thermodesulfobacteriota bacterium]